MHARTRTRTHPRARAHTLPEHVAAMKQRTPAIQNVVIYELDTTFVGFERARGETIGLAGRRLSHSANVSLLAQASRELDLRL